MVSTRSPLTSLLFPVLFLLASVIEVMDLGRWKNDQVLRWDVAGYYHYLPALFIHDDIRDLRRIREAVGDASVPEERGTFGINKVNDTGHYYLKFTYGTALFELPFFLIAHKVASQPDSGYAADGYSPPYQLAVALSTIFFVTAGLLFLGRSLRRYTSDLASAIALATLAFGTNLYFYSTLNAGMSHGYLFFLYALVLERTDAWHRKPTYGAALALGFAAGLATVTRPVDGLIILIPLLWQCLPNSEFRAKWKLVARHRRHVLIAMLAFVIPLVPQTIYWYITTGNFIQYSYEGEGFTFDPQNILYGLVSFRKGWFVYSPLVLLGFIGMAMMLLRKVLTNTLSPALIYFPLTILVVFSWEQWWYGGGFGARPMVNSLPLLALPIAWLADHLHQHHRNQWIGLIVVIFIGIQLNQFQQYQFELGILHWDSMNEERYWEIFLRNNWDGLRPFPYESVK